MEKNSNWAEAARFTTEQEAYIVKGMLDSLNIPSVIETTLSTVYPMTLSWAPVVLMVPEDRLEAARAALARHQD